MPGSWTSRPPRLARSPRRALKGAGAREPVPKARSRAREGWQYQLPRRWPATVAFALPHPVSADGHGLSTLLSHQRPGGSCAGFRGLYCYRKSRCDIFKSGL